MFDGHAWCVSNVFDVRLPLLYEQGGSMHRTSVRFDQVDMNMTFSINSAWWCLLHEAFSCYVQYMGPSCCHAANRAAVCAGCLLM
jgi:hypothetical protein